MTKSDTISIIAFVVGMICSFDSSAMRCGTQLVDEEYSVQKVLTICGEPSFNNGSTIIYSNKDSDGMDYRLHINSAGMVDSVTSDRGV